VRMPVWVGFATAAVAKRNGKSVYRATGGPFFIPLCYVRRRTDLSRHFVDHYKYGR